MTTARASRLALVSEPTDTPSPVLVPPTAGHLPSAFSPKANEQVAGGSSFDGPIIDTQGCPVRLDEHADTLARSHHMSVDARAIRQACGSYRRDRAIARILPGLTGLCLDDPADAWAADPNKAMATNAVLVAKLSEQAGHMAVLGKAAHWAYAPGDHQDVLACLAVERRLQEVMLAGHGRRQRVFDIDREIAALEAHQAEVAASLAAYRAERAAHMAVNVSSL